MKRRLGDRRGRSRFEIVGELWGTVDSVVAMTLLNVCRSGALVQSSVPLALESVHHIALSCDGQEIFARACVRHVRSVVIAGARERFLIGVEFLSMPSALEAQIVAWTNGDAQIATEGV